MALALLQWAGADRENARFYIDIGTNRYFQLRIGRSVRSANGYDWVDELLYTSPIQVSSDNANPFHGWHEWVLPARQLPSGDCYAQLFSFKETDGRSASFSDVLPVNVRVNVATRTVAEPRRVTPMSLTTEFNRPRQVNCVMASERYARAASLDDVLGTVIKLATPLVSQLLSGAGSGPNSAGGAGGAAGSSGLGNLGATGPLANVLAVLLQTIMGPSGSGNPSTAKSLSLDSIHLGNRFGKREFSRPFIFGIDDALIGTLAGPILQMLPQLMNTANQAKLQNKEADDKLISGILSDINRRVLLQQIADAQPAADPSAAPDLTKLMAMLQQAQAAAPAGAASPNPAPAAPKSVAKSLTMSDGAAEISSRAVVDFVVGEPVTWHDAPHVLFLKGRPLKLKIRLTVGDPAPKSALPKAIVRIVFKTRPDGNTACEKTFKLKDVAANNILSLDFGAAELAAIPCDAPIDMLAEFRWLTPSDGREFKALGSREVVFVNKTYFKSQGTALANDLELTDMSRYRPFWNKVWESPTLDATSAARDQRKYSWELDVSSKYSVVLAPDHDANGLMETRILKAAQDRDALSDITAGKLKGGIELSLVELNKLLPQWPGHAMLDSEHLQALRSESFAKANASELVTRIKLQGHEAERGMVWMVPVFNLVPCTFSTASKVDDSGQVSAIEDEVLGFPLPVASRVLCLRSHA